MVAELDVGCQDDEDDDVVEEEYDTNTVVSHVVDIHNYTNMVGVYEDVDKVPFLVVVVHHMDDT